MGPKGPPQWSGQKSSSNFCTECLRIEPPHSTQGLFSPQNTTGVLKNRSTCWKPDLVELSFPPFLAPLLLIFQGKWAKMGYLANYCSVSPNLKCRLFIKMTQIRSVGGDIWQIGGEKWGSRRRQLGTCAPTGPFQAQVLSASGWG